MSLFDNLICENPENQCYHVKPFSKTELAGVNPNTGKEFSESDIKSISNHFFNVCGSKGGSVSYCCNPFESEQSNKNMSPEIIAKYPYIKHNRQQNKLNSIDVCLNENVKECPGSDWIKPKSYDICKLEGGEPVDNKDNKMIKTYVNLQKDCYSVHCSPQEPEMMLADLIGIVKDEYKYTYYDDVNIVDAIRLDSVSALVQDYLPKIENIDRVLTHTDKHETMLHEAVKQDASKVVAFLVGKGADLNVKNINGDTPLHLGARMDRKNIVYALLNYGANINIENIFNELPIFDAVKDGSIEMLRILFQNGANIYHINKDGNNLLQVTIMYGRKDKAAKVKFLVEKGININHKNNEGKSAIDIANQLTQKWQEEQNTDMILEGFNCLTGFKTYDIHIDDDIPEILTYLQKISYKQDKNKYNDFITGTLPNGSFVEYDYDVCVGGKLNGLEKTKEECDKSGGNWTKYDNTSDKATKIHVEYQPENETELNLLKIADSELYMPKCREPMPVKLLPHMTGELDLSDKDKQIINSQHVKNNANKNNANKNHTLENNSVNVNNKNTNKNTNKNMNKNMNKNTNKNNPLENNGMNVKKNNKIIENFTNNEQSLPITLILFGTVGITFLYYIVRKTYTKK